MIIMEINKVDICCGLCWGDEAKGKIVSSLINSFNYDFVCRWGGGSNAGHTIYAKEKKYHTHIIPSGVFHNVISFIGPDCYINIDDFKTELKYLSDNGFDTNLVKVSPRAHIVTNQNKEEDRKNKKSNNSTGKGIAPCAGDKFRRKGIMVKDGFPEDLKKHIYNGKLFGNILCEGAQGFWLDINDNNYPYVTSSYTLPYSACSLGFPPQKIRNIYGAAKIYDTRVGTDPDFENNVEMNTAEDLGILEKISIAGNEFGTTTGRKRGVNWLNLKRLVESINISGTNIVIISKIDIFKSLNIYKFIDNNGILQKCGSYDEIRGSICNILMSCCPLLTKVIFSDNPEYVNIF